MQISTIDGDILEFDFDEDISSYLEYCPLNNSRGKRLLRKTLANHLLPKYLHLIVEPGFFYCPEATCPVVYFNRDANLIFSQNEIRTTVMHKIPIGSKSRPACYCKNVLESQIIEELTVKKCCDSLIDIQNFTEANTGKDCNITNPTGRCCGKQIKEIMNWVKENQKFDIEVPLLEEAMSCCNKIEDITLVTDY